MLAKKLKDSELDTLLTSDYQSEAGQVFVPADPRWHLSPVTSLSVEVEGVQVAFQEEIWSYFRVALARYASNHKADTVNNIAKYLRLIAARQDAEFNILDERDFLSAKVKAGKEREYQLSAIRGFLRFWHKSGLYGISDELIEAIGKLTFQGLSLIHI